MIANYTSRGNGGLNQNLRLARTKRFRSQARQFLSLPNRVWQLLLRLLLRQRPKLGQARRAGPPLPDQKLRPGCQGTRHHRNRLAIRTVLRYQTKVYLRSVLWNHSKV